MAVTDKVRQEVVEIVAEVAEVEPARVGEESTFEELGIDSLGGLRIVAQVERRYGIVIDESEIGKVRSMRDVFELVAKHGAEE